jgi:hypothetical protein
MALVEGRTDYYAEAQPLVTVARALDFAAIPMGIVKLVVKLISVPVLIIISRQMALVVVQVDIHVLGVALETVVLHLATAEVRRVIAQLAAKVLLVHAQLAVAKYPLMDRVVVVKA